MLTWDVFGYYLYLPAHFIYSDLSLINQEWLMSLVDTYQPSSTLYQITKLESGNWVIKYTMGLSLLYAPFFFLAHLIAEPLGYPTDGFSLPYQYSITIGGLIFAMIGLIYFTKILLHFFDKYITGIVIIIIFFGTNYFHLTIYDGTLLSHNFLFTFYAILTHYTIKWYDTQKMKHAIIIGLSIGLITLIRPTEGICVFIPLLWYNKNESYFKNKILLLKNYFPHLLLVIFCAIIILIPQFLYWKNITGNYLFYSYTNAGEGLDFLSPHTFDFLFSFRKGWFVYTPIIILGFIGFYHLYKKNKPLFYTITTFIIIDIYISSSWTTWWYAGGSFSSRSLVPAYVLLAIPIGFLIKKIRLTSSSTKVIFSCFCLLLITLNLFQSWQFENNILSKERMTAAYYFAIFGKTKVNEEDKKLLLVDRTTETFDEFNNSEDYKGKLLYQNSFDELVDTALKNDGVFILGDEISFSPGIDIQYKDLTNCDHAWIKISAKIFIPNGYDEELPLLVASFQHKDQSYKYRTYEMKKESIAYSNWNTIEADYLTPYIRNDNDNLKVYLWHRGNKEVLLDDLIIHAYEPLN